MDDYGTNSDDETCMSCSAPSIIGNPTECPTKSHDVELRISSGSLRRVSFIRMNCMLCFNITNGLLLASYMLLVLPLESQRIDDAQRSIVLGSLMGIAGATQLVNPLVGLLSDRCTSRWGRRRPFILVGGVVGIIGLLLQDYASANTLANLYYKAYAMSMIGLNTAYTAVVGIMPDMIPGTQTGTATGVAALHTVVGANLGFLVYYCMKGDTLTHLHAMYMFYATNAGICVAITLWACDEVPLRQLDMNAKPSEDVEGCEGMDVVTDSRMAEHGSVRTRWFSLPLGWSEIRNVYYIDPTQHRDFSLVFWSRTLYYFGVSAQTFFKYYLKDVVGIEDPESVIVKTAVIGQLAATFSAIVAGILSDRLEGVRRPFIYGACLVLALGNFANCFVQSEAEVLVICGFLGFANGVYMAMDAAIALDTLPSGEDAARFMGVWGIGFFLGSSVGPILGGPILIFFGTNAAGAYSYRGYAAILGGASICFLASGWVLRYVGPKQNHYVCVKC